MTSGAALARLYAVDFNAIPTGLKVSRVDCETGKTSTVSLQERQGLLIHHRTASCYLDDMRMLEPEFGWSQS